MSYFFPGQKVITTHGTVRVIAFIQDGKVYAYAPTGVLEHIVPRYDAWGGEHDPMVRNEAA